MPSFLPLSHYPHIGVCILVLFVSPGFPLFLVYEAVTANDTSMRFERLGIIGGYKIKSYNLG